MCVSTCNVCLHVRLCVAARGREYVCLGIGTRASPAQAPACRWPPVPWSRLAVENYCHEALDGDGAAVRCVRCGSVLLLDLLDIGAGWCVRCARGVVRAVNPALLLLCPV